jgi:thiamine biosynthesis lipoprotein
MPQFQTVYSRREAMGTYFEVFLAGDDEAHLEDVASAALDEVVRLEALLSRFDPASEVARINREAGQRSVRVDYEVWEILCTCREYWRKTDGFFDVTATAMARGERGIGDEPMILDEGRRTVRFGRPGVGIDLGGFGKGYALDRAAEILRHFDVTSGLLHGGTSSVLAVGRHPDGRPWPVGVRDPFGDDLSAAVAQVPLVGQGFSCSAALAPGQAESDIIDPHRGTALTEQAACVVIAPTAVEAEIISTACLGMGKTRAARYLEKNARPGLFIAWVDRRGGRPTLGWLKEAP